MAIQRNTQPFPETKENGTFERAKLWMNGHKEIDGHKVKIFGKAFDNVKFDEEKAKKMYTEDWMKKSILAKFNEMKPGETYKLRFEVEIELYKRADDGADEAGEYQLCEL